MKAGRKPLLSRIQKEFIWNNHTLGTQYLAGLFEVSEDTVRRVKVERGLQDKRFTPKTVSRGNRPNYRAKSDQYDKLKALSEKKGCKNVTEAISKYGKKNLLKEIARN